MDKIEIPISSHLKLANMRIDFAQEIFEQVDDNRPFLSKWLNWIERTNSQLDLKEYLNKCQIEDLFNNEPYGFAIIANEKIIGGVGFHNSNPEIKKTEIGYWLVESATGNGYMTQACHALINHGYNSSMLNRIVIRTDPENKASQAVAERLGFKFEGIARQDFLYRETLKDSRCYSLLRSDWEKWPAKWKAIGELKSFCK